MRADVVIYSLLSNDANVTALTTKIFPNVVPQTVALDLVLTYTVFNTAPVHTQTQDINTDFVDVQVSVFGSSYNAVQNLADVVVTALHAKSGTITIETIDFKYKNIRFEDKNDLGYDENNQVFMVALDFSIQMIV